MNDIITDDKTDSDMTIEDALNISVVIITCERPDYLKTALQSVFEQRLKPYEVIVVNDCSDADYEPVLDVFAHEQINYRRLPQRSGANTARNTGVNMSAGDVVAFLDDDDIWLDNFLSAHQQTYLEDSTIGALICGYKVMGNERKQVINQLTTITADELRLGNRFSGMSGFSAKRSILKSHPFDNELKNGQDWDLFVRIIQSNIRFINIKQALFLYRLQTPDGITAKAKKMSVADVEPRLQSAFKHRVWLGEKYYKKRVAEQVLGFLPNKTSKLSWIKKCIELVGFSFTMKTLFLQFKNKFF
ncbi:MAG: glycosyl transferase [Alteromonadaceae bacterium]|uniref:glycosyltransferase family 2 protein n=1 Tax=Paraglaciecola chathamensis TaxID=368405 RepID=UPI000C568CCC|nr:glycosyltransferase family 2 protein [Paraglaciecola agarilytica]MBN24191.1 glycosyl transferase [Alteromonadaceae bacterium]|tara:strand:- start:11535 stop:12440 length:906 start_codon:yes stop_codon:yes gene_type:complete